MIRLVTDRLVIRDPLTTDIDGWHRLLSDPKTMYYLDDIMTSSLEESRKNLEVAISESQKPNRKKYFFVIEHGNTGDFIVALANKYSSKVKEIYGMRTFYALGQDNSVKYADEWYSNMLALENAVASIDEYKSAAFHNHLLFEKWGNI